MQSHYYESIKRILFVEVVNILVVNRRALIEVLFTSTNRVAFNSCSTVPFEIDRATPEEYETHTMTHTQLLLTQLN